MSLTEGTVLDAHDTAAAREAMRALVMSRKVIVCVGSGGVGKTTTAATLGLAAAAAGRTTLVITIDPARRLANALGLEALSHHPQAVDPKLVAQASQVVPRSPDDIDRGPAPLFAMMLDLKAGWDDMLARTAPTPAVAAKIVENRFYRVLSTELPGAHEFIACEHLQYLASSGRFDLVVLDTPPTQNALDFLDAPARILGVLDNEAFRFVADTSGSLGARFLEGASGRASSVLAKFTGGEMLDELGEFLLLLKDLYEPLTVRTRAFVELLGSGASAFVVVTAPQSAVLAEAAFFAAELLRRQLPLSAAVVNRLTARPEEALACIESGDMDAVVDQLVGADDGALLAAALDQAVNDEARAASLEDTALRDLHRRLGGAPTVRLPRLSDAVHDANRLLELLPGLVGRAHS
jgi:anion-transporting  ArsA/GET3 family ATPase